VTLFGGQARGLTGSLNRHRASQVAGSAAVAIAAAALAGRWAGLPLLLSWSPGLPVMKVAGGLCLASLGLALMYPGRQGRLAEAVGVAVTLLAAFALGLLLLGVDLGVDLALDRLAPPYGATVAFGLAGASLALSSRERHRTVATGLAGLTGAIAVFVLLGYLTGVDPLYVSAALVSPPLPTAVGLLCISGGIILRIGAMPALRTPQPLWRLLIALGCAIIAPLLLFGAYAGTRVADAQINQVRADLTADAGTLSEEVDREIVGEIGELQALAVSPALRHGDFATFQRQAEASLAYRQGGNIMLVDRDMQQVVNTWVPFGTPLEKAAVPEPVKKAMETGQPQISSLFPGGQAGRPGRPRKPRLQSPAAAGFAHRSFRCHAPHHPAVRTGRGFYREDTAGGAVALPRTRRRFRVRRHRTAAIAGGVRLFGADRLANYRVGAQGAAGGPCSGAVADPWLACSAGVHAGGRHGLVAGQDHRRLGWSRRARRLGAGRRPPAADERNAGV
jgi:hypothetical protein